MTEEEKEKIRQMIEAEPDVRLYFLNQGETFKKESSKIKVDMTILLSRNKFNELLFIYFKG